MAERCNCDASCGENRYHDLGDVGCKWYGKEASYYYEDLTEQITKLETVIKQRDREIITILKNAQEIEAEKEKYRMLLTRIVDPEDLSMLIKMYDKYGSLFK